MTTLAANSPRSYELGTRNEIPVIASDIIYEGAAVGIVAASGNFVRAPRDAMSVSKATPI
jgi:hypothetical protein